MPSGRVCKELAHSPLRQHTVFSMYKPLSKQHKLWLPSSHLYTYNGLYTTHNDNKTCYRLICSFYRCHRIPPSVNTVHQDLKKGTHNLENQIQTWWTMLLTNVDNEISYFEVLPQDVIKIIQE